jgi:hypothetical protein
VVGLAGAVGAEDAEDDAARDVDAEVVDGEVVAEALADAGQLDRQAPGRARGLAHVAAAPSAASRRPAGTARPCAPPRRRSTCSRITRARAVGQLGRQLDPAVDRAGVHARSPRGWRALRARPTLSPYWCAHTRGCWGSEALPRRRCARACMRSMITTSAPSSAREASVRVLDAGAPQLRRSDPERQQRARPGDAHLGAPSAVSARMFGARDTRLWARCRRRSPPASPARLPPLARGAAWRQSSSACVGCSCCTVAGVDHGRVWMRAREDSAPRPPSCVPNDHDLRRAHRLRGCGRVSSSVSPLRGRSSPVPLTLTASALSRLAASSKLVRVRVLELEEEVDHGAAAQRRHLLDRSAAEISRKRSAPGRGSAVMLLDRPGCSISSR